MLLPFSLEHVPIAYILSLLISHPLSERYTKMHLVDVRFYVWWSWVRDLGALRMVHLKDVHSPTSESLPLLKIYINMHLIVTWQWSFVSKLKRWSLMFLCGVGGIKKETGTMYFGHTPGWRKQHSWPTGYDPCHWVGAWNPQHATLYWQGSEVG